MRRILIGASARFVLITSDILRPCHRYLPGGDGDGTKNTFRQGFNNYQGIKNLECLANFYSKKCASFRFYFVPLQRNRHLPRGDYDDNEGSFFIYL